MRRWMFLLAAVFMIFTAFGVRADGAKPKAKVAAPATEGTLRVHVVTESGRRLSHARVRFHRIPRRGIGRLKTDSRGNASFTRLPGTFAVSASHAGFLPSAAQTTIESGVESVVELRLHRRHVVLAHPHEQFQLGLRHRHPGEGLELLSGRHAGAPLEQPGKAGK